MTTIQADSPVRVKISKKLFNDIYYPHLKNEARIQIYFGGAGSGKSVFLAQRDVVDVLSGHNVLVCRAVARTIKHSVFTEVKKVIVQWGLEKEFKVNQSDFSITCKNGYQILFSGLDDVEKMKSITPLKGVFTRVRIEEATEVKPEDIEQLKLRQRGGSAKQRKTLTLSFNPILKSHHIFENYFAPISWADDDKSYHTPDNSLFILRTWYIHNKFLTEQDVYNLKQLKGYFGDVYGLGIFGVLGDVIFENWLIADLDDPGNEYYLPEAQRTNRKSGLDFGFSSDPAALPATHYDLMRKRIYIYDEVYERGLTNPLLADEIKKVIGHWYITDEDDNLKESVPDADDAVCMGTDYLICDSAEPKSIMELQYNGVNAVPAKKGKDSVNFGIQWLQQQTIIVDRKCINAQKEFQTYQWKKDKDGNSLKIPVDKNNHLIDALRYAYENDMTQLNPMQLIDAI